MRRALAYLLLVVVVAAEEVVVEEEEEEEEEGALSVASSAAVVAAVNFVFHSATQTAPRLAFPAVGLLWIAEPLAPKAASVLARLASVD